MPPTLPLSIDPGENVWPTAWFGNLSHAPLSNVTAAPWRAEHGSSVFGFDWGLPEDTEPSPRSLITLARTCHYLPPTPAPLPALGFRANAVSHLWITWRQLEPSEGTYAFSRLLAHVEAAAAVGWRVGVRLLTARVAEYAPSYLDGAPRLADGVNYDPSSARFHSRYLALIAELRKRRLCQHPALALMYVGYASTSYGDEHLGPCGFRCTADPARTYPHVRERLEAWADVCENATTKVMMGGESDHGTALGFGTRNGCAQRPL
jgi:hypothetical protein